MADKKDEKKMYRLKPGFSHREDGVELEAGTEVPMTDERAARLADRFEKASDKVVVDPSDKVVVDPRDEKQAAANRAAPQQQSPPLGTGK